MAGKNLQILLAAIAFYSCLFTAALGAQSPEKSYDFSGQVNISRFDVSADVDGGIVKITFPSDWGSYTMQGGFDSQNGTVAIRFPGSAQFTDYYNTGSLLWAHFDSTPRDGHPVEHDISATDRSLQLAYKCPYAASYASAPCPIIHFSKASSLAPAASPSGTITTILIWAVVIIFTIWIMMRFFRWLTKKPTPAAPELTTDPIPGPASFLPFEEAISAFDILNHSFHSLIGVPPGGKTMLFLGLPEKHNSEDNQNRIVEQVRQLLSKSSGEITPYQAPSHETYELAIRAELSAFVGSMGIPAYFYGFEISPVDSIPIGVRQDCENDELIIDNIPYSARTRHIYATGKSGSGKSTLLKALALQDIQHYKGIAVIDPHGDLAENILNTIPEDHVTRAVYISADNAVPIDFMSSENEREKEALVGDIIFLLQRFPGWGPRMDSILRDVLYTLLEAGDTCFLDIYYFLTDVKRRNEILSRVKDRDLLRTWNENFPRGEAIEPIVNRMKIFVRSSSFQTFMGGGPNQLDLYEVMQEGKILLVNLVTAGRESGDLLGALIVSKLQQASMRRHTIPPHERRPFYIYTDEFQRFQTTSFDIILSETRKYEVGLVMANQFPDQLESKILSSVIGNVSTFFLFQLEPKDARHFVAGITMRPPRAELLSKIRWDPDSLTIKDLARAKRPVPPELLSDFPIGYALYKSANGDAHFTSIFPNEDKYDHNRGDRIRKSTLAQYGMNRIVDNSSCNSSSVRQDVSNDHIHASAEKPEVEPGSAPGNIPPHED